MMLSMVSPNGVEFDEDIHGSVRGPENKISTMSKFLIKLGVVKTEKAANKLLILVSIVLIAISVAILVYYVFAPTGDYNKKGFLNLPSGSPAYSKTYFHLNK